MRQSWITSITMSSQVKRTGLSVTLSLIDRSMCICRVNITVGVALWLTNQPVFLPSPAHISTLFHC
jgi:hypothetical protein